MECRSALSHQISEKWRDHGGWSFAIQPDIASHMNRAIWLAAEAPSVIIFQNAAGDFNRPSIHSTLRHYELLQDRATSKGRHLVLGDGRRCHRILILEPCSAGSGYLVPQDQWIRTRLGAIEAFNRSFRQCRPAKSYDALIPTVYQKRRLSLLLNIFDVMHRSDNHFKTTRELAQSIIYRNADLGRAIEWKSSSHRRQTQRLINEARYLVKGGYRWLLKGRMPPKKFKL